MRKLLLMMSCVAGIAYATENMDMSNMDMSNMKGMESSCKSKKKMSSECKAMMKSHHMKGMASGSNMKM